MKKPTQSQEPETPERRYFRRRLQESLDQRGWSQSELARRMKDDTEQSTVSDWLNPKKRSMPLAKKLERAAQALGVSMESLLGVPPKKDGGRERAYRSGYLDALGDVEVKLTELRRDEDPERPIPLPDARDVHQAQDERGLRDEPNLRRRRRRGGSA